MATATTAVMATTATVVATTAMAGATAAAVAAKQTGLSRVVGTHQGEADERYKQRDSEHQCTIHEQVSN
ncbi:MAG: hypothetical protein AB7I37_00130 [Pirellulales bacterium]